MDDLDTAEMYIVYMSMVVVVVDGWMDGGGMCISLAKHSNARRPLVCVWNS